MEFLTQLLYWISTGLLVPVIVALIYYLVVAFLQLGGLYGTFTDRLKYRASLLPVMEAVEAGARDPAELPGGRTALARALPRLVHVQSSSTRMEKVAADFELDAHREVGRARTLVRMGPTLGLMGTLIPMGPALVGLARGDVATLAENLQVAFSTTVLGLLIGGVGFLIMQARQQWLAEDANTLHYIYQLLRERSDAPFIV